MPLKAPLPAGRSPANGPSPSAATPGVTALTIPSQKSCIAEYGKAAHAAPIATLRPARPRMGSSRRNMRANSPADIVSRHPMTTRMKSFKVWSFASLGWRRLGPAMGQTLAPYLGSNASRARADIACSSGT